MASATDIASPEPGAAPRFLAPWGSRLGQLIITLNLLGLAVLIGGALVLNELRQGLINARINDLTTQGQLIANVINKAATVGEPAPALESDKATEILQLLFIPHDQRGRLFDASGKVLVDSYVVADRVEEAPLPPAKARGAIRLPFSSPPTRRVASPEAKAALRKEISEALRGRMTAGVRVSEDGHRVVSVSIPIRHVEAVLGVLTLEANDVDKIIAGERWSLLPFILIAVAVSLVSSALLNHLVAGPVIALARAADGVRLSRAKAISLPKLAGREDEIGALTRSLEDMTTSLAERMGAIERFAADVAHEIKNPLTSIGSAVETLELVADPSARQRLARILRQDVRRLDRLVTDISNASRLDAELARDDPRPVDLVRLTAEVCSLYAEAPPGAPMVLFAQPAEKAVLVVPGREGPIGQVVRNLIDNARSFSPPDGAVRVSIAAVGARARLLVEDDGPGIPPENLETIFQRFYTARPKGAAFGGNSGLGLSIARQIVETHGGEISAANRMTSGGQVAGATFTVLLPLAPS